MSGHKKNRTASKGPVGQRPATGGGRRAAHAPSDAGLCTVYALAMAAVHYAIFGRYLPSSQGTLGHDYAYFFPKMLSGYYWFKNNGLFAVPWFAPGFCGGTPFYANPQSIYYSFPQLATWLVNPLTALRLTLVLFAALGCAGMYGLLRRVYGASRAAAMLGAAVFTFNGFYAHRMLIGHLTFHSFMLLPGIALLLLLPPTHNESDPPDGASRVWHHGGLRGVLAGLGFAYMFQSGNVYGVVLTLFSVVTLALFCQITRRPTRHFVRLLGLSGLVAGSLCAAKLVAAAAYAALFPRPAYPLAAVDGVWSLLSLTFHALFLTEPSQAASSAIVNSAFAIGRHELEYGVTLVPLLVMALVLAVQWRHWRAKRPTASVLSAVWACIAARADWPFKVALLVLLVWPLAANYYNPLWTALLKQQPILGASIVQLRWFATYLPLLAVATALAAHSLAWRGGRAGALVVAAVGLMLVLTAKADRSYYVDQPYHPAAILAAYARASTASAPPPIVAVGQRLDPVGKSAHAAPLLGDELLVAGVSQARCYEPMFGYRLEQFPVQSLQDGDVTRLVAGRFNMKNPACFIYPSANGCTPGEHFRASQEVELAAFASYKPFGFAVSRLQQWANAINLGAVILVALGVLGMPAWAVGRKFWGSRQRR